MKRPSRLLALAVLVSGACDFNIANPNSPAPIGDNPSRAQVAAAATGILLASRSDYADWVLDAGIIGREAYRFDGSDPRFISELLQGPLDPGSGAFGGDHWFEEYRTIRSAYNLLNVIGTASALSAAEQSAVRGFAETILAHDLLIVLDAHTQDSIPLATNRPITDPPAPLVSNDSARKFVSAILDTALNHLNSASASFPVDLPPGFAGFTTPATFKKFNRALKARVEVYRGSLGCGAPCYTAAKTILETAGATFIDTSATADMSAGVYHTFGTGPGDIANFLAQDPQTSDNLVHPSLKDSVETKAGGDPDDRYTRKTVARPARSAGTPPLSSDRSFIMYPTPSSPIAIIRNEELILLRAEANNALGSAPFAANDVNYVRVKSGGLAAIGGLAAQSQPQILGQILKERKYSLLYEGGHRWVDMRRTGRLNQIPLDRPTVDTRHSRLPIPTDEVLARK